MKRIKIVICGSGNAAHVVAGLAASDPAFEVQVFTRDPEKATQWNSALKDGPMVVRQRYNAQERVISEAGNLSVTNDPEAAGRGCDMLILVVPAFSHSYYLELLEPYLDEGVAVVGFPGQNGFYFEARQCLSGKQVVLIDFESSPWSCRTMEFGRAACILGAKAKLVGAVKGELGNCRVPEPFQLIRRLFGRWTEMVEAGSLLSVTLMAINAYSHPPIMYATWKDWDGKPVSEPPLFYHDISRPAARLLTEVSAEGQAIARGINERFPEEDMSQFIGMREWDISRYGHLIQDKTDQYSVLRTNRAYADIRHPMLEVSGGYVPNFCQRFLSEDVPFGLVTVRGIAELAGVSTPRIDEVIRWSQEKLGKEYLVGDRLSGRDLGETRAPQRYGYHTLEELL